MSAGRGGTLRGQPARFGLFDNKREPLGRKPMRNACAGRLALAIGAVAATALIGGAAYAAGKKDVTIALFVAIQANPIEHAIIKAFNKVAEADGAARFVVFDSANSVQTELANC